VPLAGYEKLKKLFLINVSENPVKKFNKEVAIEMLNNGLVMFSVDGDKMDPKSAADLDEFKAMSGDQMLPGGR